MIGRIQSNDNMTLLDKFLLKLSGGGRIFFIFSQMIKILDE